MVFTRGKEFILLEDVEPMGNEPAYAVKDGVIPKGHILRFLGMGEFGDPVFYYDKGDDTTHNTIIMPKQHLDRFIEEVNEEDGD